ncbi:PDZ domain-containing protein [Corynebacterium hindlerae]|uniref:endopeptidase La n=1 Tax=Corynebacterium hindlerae TaxID=699041 RepID=A0A7G5FH18_9CORY|nr:PDZ domain-containing protein [Corynebacterium hindlerae]QMV85909.1 PDZ domain-containing protein [Corynebacterium hindlerae]
MNRRSKTVIWGAIPVLAFSYLISSPTVPFTDIPLTVPYAAESPGPTFNTLAEYEGKKIVDITGTDVDQTTGNLNMTTVSVRTQMTLSQVMSRWLLSDDTIVPIESVFPPDLTEEEIKQQNQTAFSDSESSATLAAYRYLGRPTVVEVKDVMPDAPVKDLVTAGDRIVSFNGEKVESPAQLREFVAAKAPEEKVALGFEGGQTREVVLGKNPHTGKGLLGVILVSVPADGATIEYNLEDIGGPSAGLMFTLAVVDKLSPGELTGGKFIAGTGTIAESGEVGPIGGITHKIRAAKDAGAEVFLTPAANCGEAKTAKVKDITLLKVTSLTDAVKQLEAYNGGQQVTTCD